MSEEIDVTKNGRSDRSNVLFHPSSGKVRTQHPKRRLKNGGGISVLTPKKPEKGTPALTDDQARCMLLRGWLYDIHELVARIETVVSLQEMEIKRRRKMK